MTSEKASSGGVGFLGLLTVAFVVLKLTHFIDWSWWWVWSPLWLPVALVLGVCVVVLLVLGVIALFDRR